MESFIRISINLAKYSSLNLGYAYLKVLQICSEFHTKLTVIWSLELTVKAFHSVASHITKFALCFGILSNT